MTSTRTTHVIREQPNKWVYEVPLRTFHVFWYILLVWTVLWLWALVFLMNPMVAPCDTGAQTNVSGGVCYDLETREPVTSCAGWQEAADRMGPVFSWVGALQPSGLFSRRFQLSGEVQDCFQLPSVLVHVLFWIFVFCELITGYSTLVASRLNWRVVRRGARMLHQMVPDFPRAAWPRVDLLICHYGEPAEETIETLKCALAQEYVASKLHIYICDDGYYKSDFKAVDAGTAHWPTAKVNSGLVQSTGNVREAVQNFMTALAAERGGASQVDEGRLAAKVRSVMPDPSSASRVVARLDCAVGFTEDRYDLQGLPTVSYVARVKPKTHHSKAGNINNVLYNVQCTRFGDEGPATYDGGSYVCIFDNDMEPHPLFLVSSLPLFFESLADGAADADAHMPPMLQAGPGQDASPYTDAPERNALAYVQTPQYFRQNELMLAVGGDPLSHENSTFMDSALPGMDGYDSVMFVGTNVTWRREALDSIGGLQYGTVSEDFWTGHHAHWLGWKSAYLRKDTYGDVNERFRLAQGTVPPNVAASLAQRKRWHKGGVELLLGVDNPRDPQWQLPPHRLPPASAAPPHVKRYRRLHWFFARTAWMTSTLPPIFYTIIVIITSWTDTIWVYLNPLPTLCILLPRLFLGSFVSTIADSASVDTKRILAGLPEFFTYAPVRLVGTLEAFYSKVTGKPAKWGNTGGIGSGSIDELPNVVFVVLLIVSLGRSLVHFLLDDTIYIYAVLPIWAFGINLLTMYYPFVRVSIQEWAGWSYISMDGRLGFQWLMPVLVIGFVVAMQARDEGWQLW